MARIRSIKPEFWTDEKIVECCYEARLLFIGLWNFADDAGILKLSAKRLKMQIFPAEEFGSETIQGLLDELSSNSLIFLYSVGNDAYLLINGWKKHQKIDKPTYRYPFPCGRIPSSQKEFNQLVDEHSASIRRVLTPGLEGKGREGKGSIPYQGGTCAVASTYTREGGF